MTTAAAPSRARTQEHLTLVDRFSARNYAPLPVVVAHAEGCWVTDVDGKRYLDCLSAYSALNFGHRHPAIMSAVAEQCGRLTLTSRAFQNDQFGPFCEEICRLCGMDRVLPMNSGAEGVETALKTARKWGYKVKGVAADQAEIICCTNNFHGRTITVVSFSDDPQYRDGFGPFTPGFPLVPYGDAAALERAITPNTVGFLVEPIQGEGGIVVPPAGYLRRCRELCTKHRVLFIADEIQTGLARTGRMFACEHEGVKPDLLILGKALGGGVMPVSAVLGSNEVMGVFNPGDHGSTFGGNPLSCAVARAAMRTLTGERLAERAAAMGTYFVEKMRALRSAKVREIRGRGLLLGIEIGEEHGDAHHYCELLAERGVLCKETAKQVLRIAPPLIIDKDDLDFALERLAEVLM
ncbi:MAG: ornithine--oxo-acid transaminase [Phycisphaerae bacterium]|nr:ornithine--oxo-acid transaminase [Phycisphaerae bacterium]NUQ45652.1 ornithine--oxo-acid transaminase [Phycisphaerae bacterium]